MFRNLSCVYSTIHFICLSTGILFNAQDLLLYYPNDPPDSRVFVLQPSNYKLPYESIKINNKDGIKIHMFLIKQTVNSNHKPTMIYFHGNAGNMGQRLVSHMLSYFLSHITLKYLLSFISIFFYISLSTWLSDD